MMASESQVIVSEQLELTTSSSQGSLTGSGAAGSYQNPMPGGGACAVVSFPGSDHNCGEVAGVSESIGESQEKISTKCLRGGYTCCVPGCYKNTKRNKEVSFHKFPKDKVMKEKWINAIKRKYFVPALITISYAQAISLGGKKSSAKLIHFLWDTVSSDTIGRRGRMLRDVIMQIPYCNHWEVILGIYKMYS